MLLSEEAAGLLFPVLMVGGAGGGIDELIGTNFGGGALVSIFGLDTGGALVSIFGLDTGGAPISAAAFANKSASDIFPKTEACFLAFSITAGGFLRGSRDTSAGLAAALPDPPNKMLEIEFGKPLKPEEGSAVSASFLSAVDIVDVCFLSSSSCFSSPATFSVIS